MAIRYPSPEYDKNSCNKNKLEGKCFFFPADCWGKPQNVCTNHSRHNPTLVAIYRCPVGYLNSRTKPIFEKEFEDKKNRQQQGKGGNIIFKLQSCEEIDLSDLKKKYDHEKLVLNYAEWKSQFLNNGIYAPPILRFMEELKKRAEQLITIDEKLFPSSRPVPTNNDETTNTKTLKPEKKSSKRFNEPETKTQNKGGRQKDARTEWVQNKFRENFTPANILDTWDDKSDDERKAIDPNNHRRFVSVKIKDEEKRKKAREKALGLIEKKRPDDVKRKRK